jgi:hypothetical protein
VTLQYVIVEFIPSIILLHPPPSILGIDTTVLLNTVFLLVPLHACGCKSPPECFQEKIYKWLPLVGLTCRFTNSKLTMTTICLDFFVLLKN